MPAYKINRGDQTFVARDLAELKLWAASGKVFLDDLVQPPDVGRWEYAGEMRELGGLVRQRSPVSLSLDHWTPERAGNPAMRRVVVLLAGLGIVVAFGIVLKVFVNPPDPEQLLLTGKGPYALKERDALLTEPTALGSAPGGAGGSAGALPKDERVTLLRKSGEWYEVETRGGQKGWLKVSAVTPGYTYSEETHAKLDPIFNPERYLVLDSYTWEFADEKRRGGERKTVFNFDVTNSTGYWMDQVVVRITFLDKEGKEVATRDVQVADPVPPRGHADITNVEVAVDVSQVPNSRVRIIGARAWETPPAGFKEKAPEEDSATAGTGASGAAPVGEIVFGDPDKG